MVSNKMKFASKTLNIPSEFGVVIDKFYDFFSIM